MANQKSKRRKVFKFRFRKISVTVTLCALFSVLCLWKISSNVEYEKQLEFATKEIITALGSRDNIKLVKPNEETTIIKGEIKAPNDHPNLIIIVSSLPVNENRRSVIRNTWGQEKHMKGATLRFFMGKPNTTEEMKYIEFESKVFGDIIVDDFDEHYYKLPLKSLRMLKWFIQNKPPSAKFVAKTDDDVYVNATNVISYLRNLSAEIYSSFIGGQVYTNTYVETDPYSKWFVPKELWDHETKLPSFCGGPFYVMSTEMAYKLIEQCKTVPLFHLEDVYISGILGSYNLNIDPVNIPEVHSTVPRSYWPIYNRYYIQHYFNPKPILAYHTYSVTDLIEIIYKKSTTE